MEKEFKLIGLDCANCAAQLENAIQKIEGIESVSISFMTLLMELEYEEANQEEIIEKVRKVIKKEEPDVTMEEI